MARRKRSGFGIYPLEYAALGLLIKQPNHGYALYQEFVSAFDLIWKAGQAKFYTTLSDLEEDGLLSVTIEPQEGRPPRKVYHITDEGREDFMTWLYTPVDSMQAVRVEFIARLRFFLILSRDDAGQLIEQQVELLQQMMNEWQADQQDDSDPVRLMIDDYRIQQAACIVEWLRKWRDRF